MGAPQMTYGGYTFDPVPLLNYTVEVIADESGVPLSIRYKGTLTGTLIFDTSCGAGSIATIFEQIEELQSEITCETCKNLRLSCVDGGGESILLDIYPRILSLTFSETPDNWTHTSVYTIEFEWDDYDPTSCESIHSANESWSLEFGDSFAFNIPSGDGCPANVGCVIIDATHELSASGKYQCLPSGQPACSGQPAEYLEGYQNAQLWVEARMGFDTSCLAFYGITDSNDYVICNRKITKRLDRHTGTFAVTETFQIIWCPYNAGGSIGLKGLATEDYEVSVQISADACGQTVSISGTIIGLQKITYTPRTGVCETDASYVIDQTKIDNATTYWNQVQALMYCRAQEVVECILHPDPLSKSYSVNNRTGTIRYSYQFDNRPTNFIDGAKTESITISDTLPSDVVTSTIIPGRVQGPIYNDLRTVTESCRTVNVNVTMDRDCCTEEDCNPGATACLRFAAFNTRPDTQVEAFLCCLETELRDGYDIVFKRNDTVNWNPKNCRYTRNVTWCYQGCTNEVETSLCDIQGSPPVLPSGEALETPIPSGIPFVAPDIIPNPSGNTNFALNLIDQFK